MKRITIISIILFAFTVQAQNSKISGNWQLTTAVANGETHTGLKTVFIFDDKGILKASRSADSKSMNVGTWKYNKKKKILVMVSDLDKDFNGKALVVKLNSNELVYDKDGARLIFVKLEKLNMPPKFDANKPILTFKREEMFNEDGDFNYEEAESKLPWRIETIVNFLKGHNEVVYDVISFPDEQKVDAWVESEKINYNEEAQSIDVRRYSYFQNDYIDMTEEPIWMNNLQDYEYDYMFFPKENLDYYKVVGTENIETPIGNFDCTIVEGFGSFDAKIKYWMINEKPGVFAKIVKVKEAMVPFGFTNVLTLKEIK